MKKLSLLLVVILFACSKDEPVITDPTGLVTIEMNHLANGQPAQFDTLIYSIPSGYSMSITRWEYYISGIRFLNANGNTIHYHEDAHYLNGRYSDTWEIMIPKAKTGSVKEVQLTVGLVPAINISHGLTQHG